MQEEIMSGLNDLVRSGKVLYLGISDAPAWQVVRCNMIAERYGWAKFVVYQVGLPLLSPLVEDNIYLRLLSFELAAETACPAGSALALVDEQSSWDMSAEEGYQSWTGQLAESSAAGAASANPQ